jgi:hypothetical protein
MASLDYSLIDMVELDFLEKIINASVYVVFDAHSCGHHVLIYR